jgi:hypothetical protein
VADFTKSRETRGRAHPAAAARRAVAVFSVAGTLGLAAVLGLNTASSSAGTNAQPTKRHGGTPSSGSTWYEDTDDGGSVVAPPSGSSAQPAAPAAAPNTTSHGS